MRARTWMLAAIASLALVAAACGGDGENGGDGTAGGDGGDGSVTVTLGEQSGSGITGEATLTSADGQTEVVVTLENAGDGPQPIHIHPGTCEDLTPEPAYPLTDVTGGSSETMVDASLDELTGGEFAINAHESPDALDVYVACGNIEG